MKRFELENYLYDKEVLKAYCGGNSLTFDEGAYNAFVTDVINQNLKDETNHIKNICGIRSSISNDRFKISLAEYLSEEMAAFSELQDCIFTRA